ncbi:DUF732 domain-containing protein [Williamsia deligens]|uniref:DUF732 domain-containing protein n=1 Tax=Williamsia deligens TaxID=321325 RepID=A0ABW3G966_9NOCA|nr:DUF732 domain-containing protein [Williamsia deligens]MCP2193958.1 Protein of unknown function (DUF732) [Williamsia deligens]
MRKTRVRLGAAVAGIAAVAVLGACGSGDSTVSAPVSSSSAEATTSITSSAAPSSSQDASVDPSAPVGGSSLPATAPSGTAAPSGFPGGAPAPAGTKGAAYLAELKRVGVTVPNDPDNSIALGAADYICAEKARNTPTAQVKTFVTAIVASGTTDAAAASSNADKVIAAASSKYCG